MICKECKKQVPDNSAFCPFCGAKIETSTPYTCKNCGAKYPEDSAFCPYCGTNTKSANESVVTPKVEICEKATDGKRKLHITNKNLLPIILGVLLLTSLGINLYQHTHVQSLTSEIESQNAIITGKDTKLNILTKKADNYDALRDAISAGNLGYAASNFHASDSIIIMNAFDSAKKITLTANWPNGGTVDYKYSNLGVCDLALDNDNWTTSTSMSLTPLSKGVTTITFTNNVDSNSFNIVVMVV